MCTTVVREACTQGGWEGPVPREGWEGPVPREVGRVLCAECSPLSHTLGNVKKAAQGLGGASHDLEVIPVSLLGLYQASLSGGI